MEYKDTLNLIKSDFSMKANLKEKEPAALKKWNEMSLEKTVREGRKGRARYLLHDGPPYANGHIHMGHALNKVLKDIVLKYKTMRGFDTPYVPGWDTHGLPIEHKVTTELGDKAKEMTKTQIRDLCKEYALNYVNIQREEFKRLGVRADWDHPYVTLDPVYESRVLSVFKSLVDSGNVYRSKKPIYWCSECQTALAEAEVEYHDHTSHSIFVKFEIEPGTFIVIWTTTPWTLPANVGIAVHPTYEYAKVKVGSEHWIMAKALVEKVMHAGKIDSYEIVETFEGKTLEHKSAQHPFIDRKSLIVLADYVTLEDGSGCVHTAPGHGAEDFQTGLKYGLPILSPVNHEGVFTKDAGKYEGLKIWKANKIIIEDLKTSGHLIATENLSHSYPHCWRCKSPIIFRATEQWFVSMSNGGIREKVLNEIKKVNWIPSWGENRITAMISDRPDWCISRQRAWGIPIPAVYCEDCGEVTLDSKVLDKVITTVEKEGTNCWYEKDVKEFLPEGFKCPKCGGTHLKKEMDILDVWIDSGASFEAVVNARSEELGNVPADLYLEGSDQHRGWFNSSIFLSVGKHGYAPYKSVLTHGFIKDEEGRKMSKSVGNVIVPQEITEKYGADILRMWVASADYRGDISISYNIIDQQVESYRKYRNTVKFILTNISDFDPETESVPYAEMEELDKWALMRLNNLIKGVTEAYETFEFYKVYQQVNTFCVIDLSAIYLDIIKDRLYTESKKSRYRRSAQTVLNQIVLALTKLMTPILSFTCEEIYDYFPKAEKHFATVQLENWPEYNEMYDNAELSEKWDKLLKFREDVLKALEIKRKEKVIGSPLDAKVIVEFKDDETKAIVETYDPMFVADLFIASQYETGTADDAYDGIVSKVKIVNAEGKKCERCWKIDANTGSDSEYPDICPRCADVLHGKRD